MTGNNLKMKNKPQGFTLVEILVVVGVFVILTTIVVDVVLLSTKSQRQTAERQKSLTNLRYVTETISRHIKTTDIDYSVLPADLSGAINSLTLTDYQDNSYRYYQQDGVVMLETNGSAVAMTDPESYIVRQLDFYVMPSTNPFAQERCDQALQPSGCLSAAISCTVNSVGVPTNQIVPLGYCECSSDNDCATGRCHEQDGICVPFDSQPLITMVMTLETVSTKPEERQLITLQTSVSNRVYKR